MSRASGKFDWPAIQMEYIEGPDELSLRALAAKHDGAFSYFAKKARDEGWEALRADYRHKAVTKTIDVVTDTLAVKVAKIKGEALDVIEAAILNMGLSLRDRQLPDGTWVSGQIVTPSDMAKLLDRLMPLIGQPNNINENRNLGIDLTEQLPPEVARLLAEVAGERGAHTGPVGRSALPGSRPTGPN